MTVIITVYVAFGVYHGENIVDLALRKPYRLYTVGNILVLIIYAPVVLLAWLVYFCNTALSRFTLRPVITLLTRIIEYKPFNK